MVFKIYITNSNYLKTFKNIMDFFKYEEFFHNFLKDMFWGKSRENKSCPSCGTCVGCYWHDVKRFNQKISKNVNK